MSGIIWYVSITGGTNIAKYTKSNHKQKKKDKGICNILVSKLGDEF